jgi:isopentenyl-diphosphate delta-isomerase type 1
MSDPHELFDIVNQDDDVIGQAERRACHGNPALIHRAIHVLVFHPSGRLLLQKRAPNKDIQPGKWDTSVGGHLNVGESYLAAARREMAEELGLTGVALTFLYRSRIRNRIESENVQTYLAITDKSIRFDPMEISGVRYWSSEEIARSLGKNTFTPNFEEEWALFQDFLRCSSGQETERLGFCSGDSFPDLWQKFSAGLSGGVDTA